MGTRALGDLHPWQPAGLLGELATELLGRRMDLGFCEFVCDDIRGLARITGGKVELLAVLAMDHGKGSFRALIDRCKAEYRTVEVLEIMNPILNDVLKRYGFKKFSRREGDGEKVTGWRWRRKGIRICSGTGEKS